MPHGAEKSFQMPHGAERCLEIDSGALRWMNGTLSQGEDARVKTMIMTHLIKADEGTFQGNGFFGLKKGTEKRELMREKSGRGLRAKAYQSY